MEIGGAKVEDATWLQKANDYNYVSVTELDAVMKRVNLALKWRLGAVPHQNLDRFSY